MEKKLLLSFPPEATFRSVTYDLIKEFDIKFNIIKAEIETGKGGKLLLVFEGEPDNIERGIEYAKSLGINVSSLANSVFYNQEKCTSCGSCVSSCTTGALTIGAPDWKLHFNSDKCIMCRLCLTSCPLKLFSIEYPE